MAGAALLLLCALPMQGSLKTTVEAALTAPAGGRVLELYYEIPRSSLVFLKNGDGYEARYRFRVQALGRAREPLAGRVWDRELRVDDYARTVRSDSAETGVLTMSIPDSATLVSVEVVDLSSERRATGRLELGPVASGLSLGFISAGEPAATRRLGYADTIHVRASAQPGVAMDSCRFLVKRADRVVTGATVPARDSAGIRTAFFSYPVAGADGRPRLRVGDYELLVTGLGTEAQVGAIATFHVEYPFFFDDSVYQARVEQLVYVATTEESRRLKRAEPAERDSLWREFWRPRDDVPATERNEREEEYFARVQHAEEKFRHGDLGFRSDRGRVYVTYGPPDQVDARSFELDSPAYEIWYYYESGRSFTFYDRYGTGQYVLAGARG